MHVIGLLLIALVVTNGEKPAAQAQEIRSDHRQVAGENVAASRGQKVGDEGHGAAGRNPGNNVPNSTVVAIAALVVATVSAGANLLMWRQMREANRHARESFESGHRPFLQVAIGTDDQVRVDLPRPMKFNVRIENRGNGAANDISVHRGLIQLHDAHIFTWRKVPDPSLAYHTGLVSLGPGAFVHADDTQTPIADKILTQLFFAVCVLYRDDFNAWHRYVIVQRYDFKLDIWHLWGDRREAGITPSADFLRMLSVRA